MYVYYVNWSHIKNVFYLTHSINQSISVSTFIYLWSIIMLISMPVPYQISNKKNKVFDVCDNEYFEIELITRKPDTYVTAQVLDNPENYHNDITPEEYRKETFYLFDGKPYVKINDINDMSDMDIIKQMTCYPQKTWNALDSKEDFEKIKNIVSDNKSFMMSRIKDCLVDIYTYNEKIYIPVCGPYCCIMLSRAVVELVTIDEGFNYRYDYKTCMVKYNYDNAVITYDSGSQAYCIPVSKIEKYVDYKNSDAKKKCFLNLIYQTSPKRYGNMKQDVSNDYIVSIIDNMMNADIPLNLRVMNREFVGMISSFYEVNNQSSHDEFVYVMNIMRQIVSKNKKSSKFCENVMNYYFIMHCILS